MVIQRVLFIPLILAFGLALSNCAPAPAAPAPQGSTATVAAPAAAQTRLPLPPQPTSPPPPTGVPSPYQTLVPALIVSGPTLAPTGAPTAVPTVAAATKAPATAQPTATKSASTAPAAQGVATGKRTDVKFTFDPALSTIEEAEPLDVALAKVPGIFESSSSQTSAIVTYDAGLITVDQILKFFALQGHPVKPQ